MGNHAKEKKFVCDPCGKQFLRGEILNLHMKQHNVVCDKVNINYKSHVNIKDQKNLQQTSKGPIQCMECEETFSSYKNLKNHARIHKGANIFECRDCEKKIASMNIAISEEEAYQNREKVLKQFNFLMKTLKRYRCKKCGNP